ncbi:GntR family transcriptional regulator [Variovorax terrae]|uniref:GntR family transcriptional regulator n=1 Tax=Variovorax terrae TaxID=2923278 RepID=A0A9X1VYB0_9BURK|nr:GntR family transcriptional regulator [Variovorax terrae]MCJ0765886.1 GntR family transcriptional regulator [Variovorax terrae]
MNAVSRLPGTSLHHQISTLIKDSIAAGGYRPGDRLPTEEKLCELHSVSRVTVRRALKSLEQQGLILRKAGSGTFVSPKASAIAMPTPIAAYLEQVARRRTLSQSVVQEFGFVPASPDVGQSLQLEDGAPVLRVVRVRMMQGQPQVHTTVFLPEDIGRHFKRADFNRQALSELLASQGHHYARIDLITRASLAAPTVAKLLQVAVGSALVDVQRIGYDAQGRPVEYQRLLGPSDRFETHVTLQGEA